MNVLKSWWLRVRDSPAAVLGASVGNGFSVGTDDATGSMGSASINDLVGGLAACWDGMHRLFEPPVDCWLYADALALKPLLATSIPPAVSSPIFSRSRRLVSPAAISSRRFFAASSISL